MNSDGNPNNDIDNPFNDRILPNVTHANFGDAASTATATALDPTKYLAGAGCATSAPARIPTSASQTLVAKGGIVPAGDIALNDQDSLDFKLFNSRLEFESRPRSTTSCRPT